MDYQLLKKEDIPVQEFLWGRLTWFANQKLGQEDYTLGFCEINIRSQNDFHFHPNCAETLHVLSGKILHVIGDESVEMKEGDTITIAANVPHNAKNIGDKNVLLSIAYSSGERETCNI